MNMTPRRLDPARKTCHSPVYNICLSTNEFISESGYRQFPLACSRYIQRPDEVYGFSPSMQVLPSIKTLNAQKRDFLTQGHRAASPVYLTEDDGIISWNFRPGATNAGGWKNGAPTIGMLPTGNIQVNEKMMDMEKVMIDGAFLVDLFKILLADPKVFSATQIVEMVSQRGILIAPVVGRQQSEYLGQMILHANSRAARTDAHAAAHAGHCEGSPWHRTRVIYTSPLARDMPRE